MAERGRRPDVDSEVDDQLDEVSGRLPWRLLMSPAIQSRIAGIGLVGILLFGPAVGLSLALIFLGSGPAVPIGLGVIALVGALATAYSVALAIAPQRVLRWHLRTGHAYPTNSPGYQRPSGEEQ